MAEPVYKILIFLKRRPGMSVPAFREYYENTHARLCEKYAVGLKRYFRRYLDPLPTPGATEELPFDVITELWFENRSVFEAMKAFTVRGELPADVLADEERLFDRPKSRFVMVEECDSWC